MPFFSLTFLKGGSLSPATGPAAEAVAARATIKSREVRRHLFIANLQPI
jgi:hypothetical protein